MNPMDMPEVKAAVEHVRAMEVALRPFAAWAAVDQGADLVPDDDVVVHLAGYMRITWGDVRRADRALHPHRCACGHTHGAGADGEDGGCRDGACPCVSWKPGGAP